MQSSFSFDRAEPSFDPEFRDLTRTWLDPRSWIDFVPGRTQRAWEHGVPKVAQAGPRISVAYRYGMATGKAASDEY